ncbi:MAG: hypothetical protein ACFCUG_05215 [Thiotrichales bacterium]
MSPRSGAVRMAPIALLALMTSVFMAGCNTYRGVGHDLERLGQRMQGSAEPNPAVAPVEQPKKAGDDQTYVYPLESPAAQPTPVPPLPAVPRKDP